MLQRLLLFTPQGGFMPNDKRMLGLDIGVLLLRLGFGGYMLTHGWGKLKRLGQLGSDNFRFSDPIGLGPEVSFVLVTGAEFGCALLVIFGLFTRAAAIPLVFAMLVAGFIAHASDPWTIAGAQQLVNEGLAERARSKQLALMYASAFGALVFTGGGRFSLDSIVWPWWRKRRQQARG
jgi:putative oxidoreductase